MKSAWLWLVGLVLVVVLLWVTGMFSRLGIGGGQTDYQAVFLSNGQVYFGKLAETGGQAKLTDIYYLQVQQASIQPEGEQKPEVKLIKLGNEIHGPMDEMRINREQIVFVEDLKEEGKVVQAIRKFQREGETTTEETTTE